MRGNLVKQCVGGDLFHEHCPCRPAFSADTMLPARAKTLQNLLYLCKTINLFLCL